jgi:hypothetical protein
VLDGADTVVANYGLHYHNMTAYEQEMRLMARQLTRWVEEANPPGELHSHNMTQLDTT